MEQTLETFPCRYKECPNHAIKKVMNVAWGPVVGINVCADHIDYVYKSRPGCWLEEPDKNGTGEKQRVEAKLRDPESHTTEYMVFTSVRTKSTKTGKWRVENRNSGALLGIIKWHGAWRQYCFFPEADCIFNKGCLEDINEFITRRMNERKK